MQKTRSRSTAEELRDSFNETTAVIDIREPLYENLASIARIANAATHHSVANVRLVPDSFKYWQDEWRNRCERYLWLVAVRECDVVGYAIAIPFMARCGLESTAEVSVYVDPREHGTGVGSALYRALMPMLETQGFRSVVAVIAIPNPASERLPLKLGFNMTGTPSRIGWKLGEWHDLAYWQLMFENCDEGPPQIKPAEREGPQCEVAVERRACDALNANQ